MGYGTWDIEFILNNMSSEEKTCEKGMMYIHTIQKSAALQIAVGHITSWTTVCSLKKKLKGVQITGYFDHW